MTSKFSHALEEAVIDRDDDDAIDVVVELDAALAHGGETRAATVEAMRERFERDAAEIQRTITDAGGEVLDAAWLNATVRGKVPKKALRQLEEHESVVALDAPRAIVAE